MFTLTIRFRGLCVFHPKPNVAEGMTVLLVDARAPGEVSTRASRHVSHTPMLAAPAQMVTTTPLVPRREVLDPDISGNQLRVFPLNGAVISIVGNIVNPASLEAGSTVPAAQLDVDASFYDGVPRLTTLYSTYLPSARLTVNPDALYAADPRDGNAVARQFLTSGIVSAGGNPTESAKLRVLGEEVDLGPETRYREYIEYKTTVPTDPTVAVRIESQLAPSDVLLRLDPQGAANITLDLCNLPLFGVDSAMSGGHTDEDYELIYRIFKPVPAARLVPQRISEVPGHLCLGGCSAC